MMSDQEDSKRKDRASKREVSKVYDAIVKANLLGPSNDIELETGQRMSEILNSLSPDEFNAVQKAVMAASNKLELVLKSFSLDYGLTNAETGLLRSQLEGKTIVDHACANGVSFCFPRLTPTTYSLSAVARACRRSRAALLPALGNPI